ncbi:type I-U CRISPR-associated helicase/endonuclease Cas3 [Nocardia sp. BMG111209]|uniref:type I-G CRISPR-associated helicase/endonuclease Cas3g n=1 Tax=Nocardia sp. BMG111209 TaxID=1160137 RepID=UPI00035DE1EE|nr:type I-U CRISPR-associated helicase/endonuclease Cas3 [Nocardia sp. BMG111209]
MSVRFDDFEEFFALSHDGHSPFRWQTRLARQLCETGRWPDRIAAPTGAGKSSVVDIHLFANALHAAGAGSRVPRRLSVVVNRRGLVDQHALHARALSELLRTADDGSLYARIADALRSLRIGDDDEPFELAMLRGGLPRDRRWLDDPGSCTIICATPDMWGSRLLMRGYGSSRYAHPREAGLLAHDSAVIVDEAHLNRQLLLTAQRVGEFAQRTAGRIGVAALQAVETTATPATPGSDGVTPADIDAEPVLARRLRTPKPVRWQGLPTWTGKAPSARYLDDLAGLVNTQHTRYGHGTSGGRTIGCVINRVDTAVRLAALLRRQGLRVEVRVGRMRPYDLDRLLAEKPGLLTATGDATTDVLIATQTVEVGVDIDLAAMVTELAPGSALAQRAGRVNRTGRSTVTEIVVVGPADPAKLGDVPPYRGDDLSAAYEWVQRRAEDPEGCAPLAITVDPAPSPKPSRTLWQRLELHDAHLLARTSDELFAQPDLELWLRDDLEPERAMAGVVVRADLPADSNTALALLHVVPPADIEAFPCTLTDANALITQVRAAPQRRRVFIWREDHLVDDPESRLRPGDIVVIDDCHPVHTEGVVVENPSSRARPVPAESLPGIHAIILDGELLTEFAEQTDEQSASTAEERWGKRQFVPGPMDPNSVRPRLSWIVVRETARGSDDEIQQEWTGTAVTLDRHSEAVAARAATVGRRVGVAEPLPEVLQLAGRCHDLGKEKDWFQRLLGRHPDEPVLAKSRRRTEYQARRARATSGMPSGWRHEQQSVLATVHELDRAAVTDTAMRDMVLRLVGLSHGRGRAGFPHSAAELLGGGTDPVARALFDTGEWDSLIERTHTVWGIWGACYLEALLRAADSRCSQEGS